jgi:hypothetical protein
VYQVTLQVAVAVVLGKVQAARVAQVAVAQVEEHLVLLLLEPQQQLQQALVVAVDLMAARVAQVQVDLLLCATQDHR